MWLIGIVFIGWLEKLKEIKETNFEQLSGKKSNFSFLQHFLRDAEEEASPFKMSAGRLWFHHVLIKY